MKIVSAALAVVLAGALSAEPSIDFSTAVGPVKPVNAVGQPPILGFTNTSLFHYLKEAGIPYSRLHDVGYPYGRGIFVDIPNLFRDFEADENDPKNYDFAYTDNLLKALEANGVEPYYRLGVTIENAAGEGFPAYRIFPPKDYAKWARICEHVIRHYTEGWANGFKMKIAYWEIWNEPENYEEIEKNCMWKASFDEFIRFYGVVAPYLKSKFPHLKIGGYGSCGFYAGVGAGQIRAANSSPRMEYFVVCAEKFLAAARDGKWPLDFFSYHSYSNPAEAISQVRFADALLTRYGFTPDRTERHFNEWLPSVGHDNLGTYMQASRIAAELIALQNGPCDLACIYDAKCGVGDYSPLFNCLTYKPHKAYYVFKAFNALRQLGMSVKVTDSADMCDGKGLWVTAATDKKGRKSVLVANISAESLPLPAVLRDGGFKVRAIDATHDFDEIPCSETIGKDTVLLFER